MRASDADREKVVVHLRDHYAAGRLTDAELSARIDDVYRAATLRDLDVLLLDLPEAGRALARQAPARTVTRGGRALRTSLRIHLSVYVLVNVLLVAIWAAAGGGYFWPIWPILGWGMGVAVHAAPVIAGVGTRTHLPAATASPAQLVGSVVAERPDLQRATAPDGTVTILFSDIVGSTDLNQRLGDRRWLELLRRHHEIVRAKVGDCGGFEVKAQGDGFMIAFPSARRALECAIGIQRAIGAQLGGDPEAPVRVRIGLHSGEAVRDGGDFYGRNVVLAARIAEQAQPGEILVSSLVKQLAEGGGDVHFEDGREVELKGLGPHTVHRVAS